MKQYDINAYMREYTNGEWVRHTDATARIADLTAERDEARALVREVARRIYFGEDGDNQKECQNAVERWDNP